MAISAGMVWEVRKTGDDTFGGGFRGGANLSVPGQPTATGSGSGGSVAAGNYFIVVTFTDRNGETGKSPESAQVTLSGATSKITVTAPTDPGSYRDTWNIYVATATGGPYWQQSTGNAFGANVIITTTPPTSGTQAPGVDRSHQDTAHFVINNSTITSTTPGANSNTLTFTGGYTPTAADVGNVVQMTAGTNINTGFYEITAWTSTTWTVSGATNLTTAGGAGSALVGKMGGAVLTASTVFNSTSIFQLGNLMFVKYNATPYATGTITRSTNNLTIAGFDTTRDKYNTDTNRPTFQANANSITILNYQGNNSYFSNMILDANAHTGITGHIIGPGSTSERIKATGCSTAFSGGTAFFLNCQADAFTSLGFTAADNCFACSCTAGVSGATAFRILNGAAVDCISIASQNITHYSCNGDGSFVNCNAYCSSGQVGTGFSLAQTARCYNCVSWSMNINYGGIASSQGSILVNCAGGGAAGADTVPAGNIHGFITLTADPFTNGGGNDFSLNNTAGGGILLKAAGYPTSFSGLSTNTFRDDGAVQAQALTSTDPGVANVLQGVTYTINGNNLTGTLVASSGIA